MAENIRHVLHVQFRTSTMIIISRRGLVVFVYICDKCVAKMKDTLAQALLFFL